MSETTEPVKISFWDWRIGRYRYAEVEAGEETMIETIQAIEVKQCAEANLTARIEELSRQYQEAVKGCEKALQQAQAHGETMLKLVGAIDELERLKKEIWGGEEDGGSTDV